MARLLAVLPLNDRAPFALAAYATGRRQEIRYLRWEHVDLEAGLIRWAEDEAARKTPNAQRLVPIVAPLRAILEALRDERLMLSESERSEYVCVGELRRFARGPRQGKLRHSGGMMGAEALLTRCRKVWKAAGLEPIGLHDCRHCAASYMIKSGADLKALSVLMGHGSISITIDRYGHMLPGSEAEVGKRLEAYLAGALVA